jgi:hypothetical protein
MLFMFYSLWSNLSGFFLVLFSIYKKNFCLFSISKLLDFVHLKNPWIYDYHWKEQSIMVWCEQRAIEANIKGRSLDCHISYVFKSLQMLLGATRSQLSSTGHGPHWGGIHLHSGLLCLQVHHRHNQGSTMLSHPFKTEDWNLRLGRKNVMQWLTWGRAFEPPLHR